MSESPAKPDTSHEPDSNGNVETEGLNANALTWIIVGSLSLILVVAFSVVAVTNVAFHDALIESTEVSGYPVLQKTQETAEEVLTSYAPIDRDAGLYRITIDRAMELIVEEAQQSQAEGGN